MRRHYARLADARDFEDPDVLAALRSILPERDPAAHVERKAWEMAMLALFLDDVGALHDRTEALAIGAGDERIVFWLANRLVRVVAIDVYGEGPFATQEATATMLTDPNAHAPFPYREERLEVRWMDARALDFPDASFDVAFSLSSFEHFGGRAGIAQAARELGRVLRPGGYAFLAVDTFVRRDPLNAAPVDFAIRLATLGRKMRAATPRRRAALGEVLTPGELQRWIVEPSDLEQMQPFAPRTERPLAVPYKRSTFTSAGLPLRKRSR
jgi:SAM-dependent methyltransferase